MSIKRTFGKLGAIALLGTIGFAPFNNTNAQKKDYEVLKSHTIKINGEIVTYTIRLGDVYEMASETIITDLKHIITVKKQDGRIIKYIDNRGFDLKIERIDVRDNDADKYATVYNDIGSAIIKEGQKRFDWYFQKIEEDKERKEKVDSERAKKILD